MITGIVSIRSTCIRNKINLQTFSHVLKSREMLKALLEENGSVAFSMSNYDMLTGHLSKMAEYI